MGELRDIMHRNLMTTRRKAGESLNAGYAVRASGTADTVVYTENASCATYAFEGVTLDSVRNTDYVSVAVAPSEVYVNSTGTIGAGKYVTPSTTDGTVRLVSSGAAAGEMIVGRTLEAGGATKTGAVLIKLMDGWWNISS